MKKSKLKSPKRKVISHRYQKNSNTSLSKLLHIASYKKRINDLVYNNRRLARELQDAKREIAAQNKLLDKGAKSRNEVMFARLKLQDMATSITSLVADLDQARNHLLNSLSSDEIKFPMKEFPHPKKVVPTVDCIEEVSYVSSLDPSFKENTSPQPEISSLYSPSHVASVKMNKSDKILLDDSQSHDPEDCEVSVSLAPILFVEDNRDVLEKNVEQSSQTSSCQPSKGDARSLTPELDIDFSLVSCRKSSSRRQTQFKLSNPRTAKSGSKSSPENSLPLLVPEKNHELCLLSNSYQTKVSNSRKTKSKGQISPEATSPLLKSKLIENSSPSNNSPNNNCKTAIKVSDIKKAKSTRKKSSPQVISPPLNFEDSPVPAFRNSRSSLVKVSNTRKTKSRGKSSLEFDSPSLQSEEILLEASNSRRKTQVKITNVRKQRSSSRSAEAASTRMKCGRVSIETDGKQQDINFNSSQSNKQHENLNNLSNLHCITEKLPSHFSNCLTSDVPSDCGTFEVLPDVPPNVESLVTIPNHTLYLSEDMELTDVIAANPVILEYGSLNNECYSEINSHIPVNSNCFEKYNNSEEKPLKLDDMPEVFVESNSNLPIIIKDNVQESAIIEQSKIFEVIEDKTEPLDDSLLISSPKRGYRKNAVQYCFFSSSEPSDSDDEYIPRKSRKKKSSSNEKRETVIFKPDSNLETSSAPNNFSEPEENIAVKETSIFHFNVSHSEDSINQNSKNRSKKSKLSRDKKSGKKKDLPMKPLSQTCNVTKLKGFSYKFSKSKSPVGGRKLSKGYKQKKSGSSSCTSVLLDDSISNGHTSHHVTNVSQDKFSEFQVKDGTKSVEALDKSVLKDLPVSECTPVKQDTSSESVQSERKKVSFAPTDLVCKFRKMSLSKAIAANAKVRRVSKSVAELVDWSEENVEMKPLSFDKLSCSEDSLSDFNAETELYTINSPSAPYLASQETNHQCPLNSVFSSIVECDMPILPNKNLANKNIKKEKVSKTRAVASQQKLLPAVSPMKNSPELKVLPKKDTTKRSPSLNKAKDSKQLLFSDEINDTKDSLCNFSDTTEQYSVNLSSPSCLALQKIDQKSPLNSVAEWDVATTPNKNLTNKNDKREKVSKTRAVSQQKLLQVTSPVKRSPESKGLPVKDTTKRSPSLNKAKDSKKHLCLDKMNDSKDSLCDFSDITELYSVNLPSDVLYPVDQQPPSNINIPSIVTNKEVLDTCTKSLTNENILNKRVGSSQKRLLSKVSPAKRNSGFKILSVKTSKKSVKLYNDSKENRVQKHLEIVRPDRQIKQRDPLSPIQPPQDDIKIRPTGTAERKLTSSAKSKKKVAKKITKSAPPVLKDHLDIRCSLMEIQAPKLSTDMKDAAGIERPKRRSNAVSYKEPSIRKKLRRS